MAGLEVLQVSNGYEKIRCEELLKSLMASSGDTEELQRLLHNEALDGPAQYIRVLSTTMMAFFVAAWPKILSLLDVNDLDHESVLRILEMQARTVAAGDAHV